jgi:hypothetical protein
VTTATAQRAALASSLDAHVERARRLAAEAGPSRWKTRPAPDAWSASDCVQHLVTTAEAFIPRFAAASAHASALLAATDAPYRVSLGARLFIWSLEPPYRLRLRTGAPFVPDTTRDPEVDLAAFAGVHDALRDRLASGAGLPLDRLMVASPFAERLRYSIYTSLRIIVAHERRHLWQAERAVAALDG